MSIASPTQISAALPIKPSFNFLLAPNHALQRHQQYHHHPNIINTCNNSVASNPNEPNSLLFLLEQHPRQILFVFAKSMAYVCLCIFLRELSGGPAAAFLSIILLYYDCVMFGICGITANSTNSGSSEKKEDIHYHKHYPLTTEILMLPTDVLMGTLAMMLFSSLHADTTVYWAWAACAGWTCLFSSMHIITGYFSSVMHIAVGLFVSGMLCCAASHQRHFAFIERAVSYLVLSLVFLEHRGGDYGVNMLRFGAVLFTSTFSMLIATLAVLLVSITVRLNYSPSYFQKWPNDDMHQKQSSGPNHDTIVETSYHHYDEEEESQRRPSEGT